MVKVELGWCVIEEGGDSSRDDFGTAREASSHDVATNVSKFGKKNVLRKLQMTETSQETELQKAII